MRSPGATRICGKKPPDSVLLLPSPRSHSRVSRARPPPGGRDALLPVPAAARTRAAAALLPPQLRRAPVPCPRAHLPSGVPAAASFPYYRVPRLRRFGSARPGSPRDRSCWSFCLRLLLFVMGMLGAENQRRSGIGFERAVMLLP
jgi:hypothetical protein